MEHLRPSILVLTRAGVGDRENLARGLGPHEVDRWVLDGESRADVAVDPFDVGLRFAAGPLGDEVVHVGGPVLDGRIGNPRALESYELHHGRVEGVGRVDRGRTSFDVVHLGTLVGDDQRPLELTHVLRVNAKVRLQGHFDLDAGWHVDERTRPTTRPS